MVSYVFIQSWGNVRLLLLAPCAGPSGGEDEAGKPSGGRRKGDPRHGRRVAPGRRRPHQSEGLSRQFGNAAGLLRAAASALNPPPPKRRWAKHPCWQRAERTRQIPLPETGEHPPCARLRCANRAYKSEFAPRGQRWAALNAQRQPTRAVPAPHCVPNDTPNGTPKRAPCAGPSGGEDEAGKPSGGRRKGDPRHGRRVAPGRRRPHQSEGLSRQFGNAAGLLRAAASALNPPPPKRRWAKHPCWQRAERTRQIPLPETGERPITLR